MLCGRARACTTLVAALNGTTFATHTADCQDCDFRIAKVPREVISTGGDEDVMLYRRQYPREVSDRAATWSAARLAGPSAEHVEFWASAAFRAGQYVAAASPRAVIDAVATRAGGRVGGETSLSYYEVVV